MKEKPGSKSGGGRNTLKGRKLSRIEEKDRKLLMAFAQKVGSNRTTRKSIIA
jgi:hypothetical protein